jgi:hypothetical protein
MGYAERKELISRIEKVRGSRVLAYVLGDRPSFPDTPGFSIMIEPDVMFRILALLRSIGHGPKIDLFLYTRGGNTDVVWPLVCSIREHTDHFTVIVPFRAHSGGTLICLGADEVIMTDVAELSPIDPTTGNQFNPLNPSVSPKPLGISVEDVAAYFKLAEVRAGLTDEASRLEVFKQLTQVVHPLAIGNVQRVYQQIRRLAPRLLELHLDQTQDAARIKAITDALSEQFYSHIHAVTRREATVLLGDWARAVSAEEEGPVQDLLDAYVADLELNSPFQLPEYMGDNPVSQLTARGGYLETTDASFVHETAMKIAQQPQLPPNMQIQMSPGAPVPLPDWAPRSYVTSPQRIGWWPNDKGV